jgi:hypothetical protein
MDDILDHVRASLAGAPIGDAVLMQDVPAPAPVQELYAEEDAEGEAWNEGAEDEFMDTGEGAGIEGDLDVEDD